MWEMSVERGEGGLVGGGHPLKLLSLILLSQLDTKRYIKEFNWQKAIYIEIYFILSLIQFYFFICIFFTAVTQKWTWIQFQA